MSHLFSNMLPYEVILTVMGMIFFLILMFLVIWNVIKNRSITVLLPFFLIPVIMVAYPTIQSIKIGDIVINTNNLSKIVSNDPTDTTAAKSLEKNITLLKTNGRLFHSSTALLAVANAQIALGRLDSASVYLNKAEIISPASEAILSAKNDLKRKVMVRKDFSDKITDLNNNIEQLKRSPGDKQSVNQIAKIMSELQVPAYVSPSEAVTIAKSYAITGNQAQSLQIINRIDPSILSEEHNINNLKDSIQNRTYQMQFFKQSAPPRVSLSSNPENKDLLNKVKISKAR